MKLDLNTGLKVCLRHKLAMHNGVCALCLEDVRKSPPVLLVGETAPITVPWPGDGR